MGSSGGWRPGANNGGPVILGDSFDDGSRRYRERQVAAAMDAALTVGVTRTRRVVSWAKVTNVTRVYEFS